MEWCPKCEKEVCALIEIECREGEGIIRFLCSHCGHLLNAPASSPAAPASHTRRSS